MSLCEICGQREATHGVIRPVGGVDQTTRYCPACEPLAPRGHTVWGQMAGVPVRGPRAWLPIALLVLMALAAAYGILRAT